MFRKRLRGSRLEPSEADPTAAANAPCYPWSAGRLLAPPQTRQTTVPSWRRPGSRRGTGRGHSATRPRGHCFAGSSPAPAARAQDTVATANADDSSAPVGRDSAALPRPARRQRGHRPGIPDLLERIRSGFRSTTSTSRAIDTQPNWFANHPDFLERTFGRSELWLYYIVGQLEQRNMPRELALLPVIESAFEPYAYSRRVPRVCGSSFRILAVVSAQAGLVVRRPARSHRGYARGARLSAGAAR